MAPTEYDNMIAAIHGAIGWIAGTTNEGNHDIGKFTREQLAEATKIIRRARDEAVSPQVRDAQDLEATGQ